MDASDKTSCRRNVLQFTKIVENSNVEQIVIGVPNNYFFGHVDPFAENTVSDYECIDHKWAKLLPLPNSREDKCIGRKSY